MENEIYNPHGFTPEQIAIIDARLSENAEDGDDIAMNHQTIYNEQA